MIRTSLTPSPGPPVIRFACPNCDRPYYLPDALAHVPLLCRGCGQRVNVPDAGTDEPPRPTTREPITEPAEGDARGVDAGEKADAGVDTKVGAADAGMIDFGVHKPDDRRILLSDEVRERLDADPPRLVSLAPAPGGRPAVGLVVDAAVGLALAGVGVLLGEFAVRRSSAAVIEEAGSATKFPPIDLLVWLGCVATPLLVYALLANRGKTVGGWLRRRGG